MSSHSRISCSRRPGWRPITFILLLSLVSLGGCASLGENASQANPEPAEQIQSSDKRSSTNNANGDLASSTEGQTDDDFEPTVVAYRDYRDPLIRFNRAMFAFNDVSYRYLLIPLAKGYTNTVPTPVQQSVSNFFYNIKAPIYTLNNILQLKPKAAGTNIARFGINSTIGILGLFDPAYHWFDLEKADTSLGETLAQYGAGYGFYLVLPLLGPSDLRSGTSSLVEGFLHPVSYISEDRDRIIIQGFDYFQDFAPEAASYNDLVGESEDPYIFIRNFYLQNLQRDADYHRNPLRADED